jgi:hypothetical protein
MFICYFPNPIAILNHRTQMEKVTVDPTEVACMEAESYNVVERDGTVGTNWIVSRKPNAAMPLF